MTPLPFTLDHGGVGVRDLEAGRRAYARLGFRLTARSMHSGARVPGGPVEAWGSGNHCAMFRDGYLEVIGLVDPTRYSSLAEMVGRYEGVHIVAIGCGRAEPTWQALRARGVAVDPPRALERDAAWGPEGREMRRARFRNMWWPRDLYTEARFIYIEHETPDVLWQPQLLDHPNGALAITDVWLAAPDPGAIARKLAPMLDRVPEADDAGGRYRFALARGALHVVGEAAWRALSGGAPTPPLPAPVGLGFAVRSVSDCARALDANGVPYARTARGGLRVGAADACGAVLFFDPA